MFLRSFLRALKGALGFGVPGSFKGGLGPGLRGWGLRLRGYRLP